MSEITMGVCVCACVTLKNLLEFLKNVSWKSPANWLGWICKPLNNYKFATIMLRYLGTQ